MLSSDAPARRALPAASRRLRARSAAAEAPRPSAALPAHREGRRSVRRASSCRTGNPVPVLSAPRPACAIRSSFARRPREPPHRRRSRPAAHRRRHAGRSQRRGSATPSCSPRSRRRNSRGSGGAVRPHGARTRRRRRRRPQVVDSQPAARRLLGRLQRHVPQRSPALSAPQRKSTRAAIGPPTSGSSSGTRSAGRDRLDSRA